MSINVRRVYEEAPKKRGKAFLVDRLWPRGIKKEELDGVDWVREVAPSASLRKWFGHEPKRWKGFMSKYFKELDKNPEAWEPIFQAARKGSVTLLYGAKDTEHNQAVALQEYFDGKLKHKRAS